MVLIILLVVANNKHCKVKLINYHIKYLTFHEQYRSSSLLKTVAVISKKKFIYNIRLIQTNTQITMFIDTEIEIKN